MNNVILIPSYCPGSMLTDLTKELVKDFQNVIVVNDGSPPKFDDFFSISEKTGRSGS